jgi:hypothetical protein
MIQDPVIKAWYDRNRKARGVALAKVFDVEYAHLTLRNRDDLYVTRFGVPHIDILRPENYWTDEAWFEANSEQLSGTSTVFRVRTKEVAGRALDIVLKWNRMGQEVPGSRNVHGMMFAEFNSPFEEFSLVMELKNEMRGDEERLSIQTPLAIYVPADTSELWQLGRKHHMMQALMQKHRDVELDMHRSYAVIYEWIHGHDLLQARDLKMLRDAAVDAANEHAHGILHKKGFVVKDYKPEHVILRGSQPARGHSIEPLEAPKGLVDFELLAHSPERYAQKKKDRRTDYLQRQKDRFRISIPKTFHPHLKHVNILGVDYVYGQVESTKGRLWVAGRDPHLFDFFLPEKWEQTPRTKISTYQATYYTVTKDHIHLVWKVSRVGLFPDMDPFKNDEKDILEHGYNSPFEEFSIALEMADKGIPTIYPRAIYMSGNKTRIPKHLLDKSRYKSHARIKTPDRRKVLVRDHEYVVIWGYWNGPDDKLATKDGDYYEGVDTLRAYREGIISEQDYIALLQRTRKKLRRVGVEDLYTRGSHFLISIDSRGNIVRDERDKIEIRVCAFEFLKRIEQEKFARTGLAEF